MTEPRSWKDEALMLAQELLEIAELAMPASYFQSDSRCEHARRILERGEGGDSA